jgi:ABC-2 type transport system ATP-binding protein
VDRPAYAPAAPNAGVRTPESGRRATEGDVAAVGDPPALAVDGVTKRFGSGPDAVTAVDDVSFSVAEGSVVGLLGPNGAGKTTLVKCVLGMVLPDAGTARVHGVDVLAAPREAYARVDAMLEGARNDYWRLTVRENLRYFATVGGVDPDSVAGHHDDLLERFELAAKADTPVRDLSRGMKQKVSLASVLAGRADVVFLDEPTLGLDVEASRTLRRELRRLVAERGLTVVLSSHDMDVVEAVCDRVVMLADGRVVADDAVDALLGGDGAALAVTSPDLDETTVAALRERFPVTDVAEVGRSDAGAGAAEGSLRRVTVAVDGEDLYALLDALRSHGVTVERLRTVEPDLEQRFVELTGLEGGGGEP